MSVNLLAEIYMANTSKVDPPLPLWVIPVEWIINEGGGGEEEKEREKEREKKRKKERKTTEKILAT